MKQEQMDALRNLAIGLQTVAAETEQDDNFNILVADLEIFNMDLLEAWNKVSDLIDKAVEGEI